jgi:hypothetical protein
MPFILFAFRKRCHRILAERKSHCGRRDHGVCALRDAAAVIRWSVDVGVRGQDLFITPSGDTMKPFVAGVLALWFVVVFVLGAAGVMAQPPGTPPIPILIGATTPVIVFLVAYWGWPAFRAYVLSLDPALAAAIQGWRAAGLGFLALYAHGVLPGVFAWPAGLGDIAIGVTAPWVAQALVRRPGFLASQVFVVWNLLGILDLLVAVSLGGLSSVLTTGSAGGPTTAPMAQLPLVLIPAYLVPLFVVLHLAVLLQARRQASSRAQV